MQQRVDEIGEVFAALERIVARGQAAGDFRADIEPRLASWILYGAIEEILTGWVLGQLPDGDDEVALGRADRRLARRIGGLSPAAPTA